MGIPVGLIEDKKSVELGKLINIVPAVGIPITLSPLISSLKIDSLPNTSESVNFAAEPTANP
jgi:hypothetical protein